LVGARLPPPVTDLRLGNLGVRLMLLLLIAATIGCDRVAKRVAATALAGTEHRSFFGDTVRLQYVENAGAFLGLGAEWPAPMRTALFSVGNGLLLFAMAFVATRLRWRAPGLLGLALLFAGGASNLLDRLTSGKVIDFMNIGLGSVRTGVFNVADMAIMLGAI